MPPAHPHAALYRQWFDIADKDGDERLTGKDAVHFFARSGLTREMLAKVWSLADSNRRGFLDVKGFIKAMDLIAIAQAEGDVTQDLYEEQLQDGPGSPPEMKGLAAEASGSEDTNPFDSPSVEGKKEKHKSDKRHSEAKASAEKLAASSIHASGAASEGSPFNRRQARKPIPVDMISSVVDGLKQIYFQKVRPLEETYKFGHFFSPCMVPGDFEAKPSVLLLGQYSTGKTTFIKHLLGQEYPGMHIGPEPTTDRFVVVMHGHDERRTPGNTLAVQPDKPYQGLSIFGGGFLSKFEGASSPNEMLEAITLVDTPGVLSGEKQRIERTYDFIEVCRWFAARCDVILLLFDPYKLDISDEFRNVISTLKGHDDKIRVVLNKADQVDQQQLMRVYGALMWSLGKVIKSPEVCRVYIGSFNASTPIREDINPTGKGLFEAEQNDLLSDLSDIPARSCDRKVNEFVKRVRACRIHVLVMGHLRKQLPTVFGKKAAQDKLLGNLRAEFEAVQKEYHLPPGDFPDPERFRNILEGFDISSFPKLDKKMVKTIDEVLNVDIPALVKRFDNPYN
eukprot:jgi/Tetstr1/440238/TSEL_028589.t1